MEKAFKLDFVNDKTGSLYVNCCGCSQTAPLHSFGPASKPHYLIHYVLSGKGHFRFHDKEYRLEAGYGFLIQPNELAFYQADAKDPWSYLWVGFAGSRILHKHGEVDGTAGNVYGYLKGTLPGDPILFSAHMDTVRPGIGKKMFLNEATGKIESGKDTILGADDVTGLVEILEAVRHLQEEKIPYRDIEVIFPIAEELYIKGTDAFDFSQVKAKEAYVLDMGGAPGAAALRAPSLISFTVNMHGKASHAGFAPEQGIHAIRAVSLAISRIEQGQVDEDSTLNIGKISGGEGTNIMCLRNVPVKGRSAVTAMKKHWR